MGEGCGSPSPRRLTSMDEVNVPRELGWKLGVGLLCHRPLANRPDVEKGSILASSGYTVTTGS